MFDEGAASEGIRQEAAFPERNQVAVSPLAVVGRGGVAWAE
jgi:hypothetical protein